MIHMSEPHSKGRPDARRGSSLEPFGSPEWGLTGAIALIWGSSFLFIAIALETFDPSLIAFSRLALGTATVGLFPAARRRVDPGDRGRLVVLGITWMGIPLLLIAMAQVRVGSAVAGMANGTLPIFAALIAWGWMRRFPRAVHLAGIGLGFVGVVLISLPSSVEGFDNDPLGLAQLLAAFGLLGLAANLAVPLQRRYGSLPVVFHAQIVGLVVLAPLAVVGLPRSTWSWASASALLPLGILSSGIAFIALATLLGTTGADRGTIPTYLVPVVAIALGVIFRGETIAPAAIVGTGLVLVGSWLASRGT